VSDCDLEGLKKEILKEFPDFKVVPKAESSLMKVINVFLLVVSFGRMKQFMTSFATTIGTTVYVTDGWKTSTDQSKAILLRHERVHMRQAKRLTRPLFSFLYLFCFLPVGLAWFRARFEREAYEESFKAAFEYYGREHVFSKEWRDHVAKNFTGPSYLYMWPFPKTVDKWMLDAAEKAVGKETS
jgi:hypothetical protein